ncbi:MAG: hypothetical protein A2078_15660 [Nitrospirae bacterium GWC2_57_9]|nr:MAG: hypothetical protein A2078_15660 [Nitrospirae bacterium GWC2_57_9]
MSGCLQTGQITCHDAGGREVACAGTGQDGEFRRGIPWPEPRFEVRGETILDRLTGLVWLGDANFAEFPLSWQEALDVVGAMNRERAFGSGDWRVPNRRELRSLMSLQTSRPALPAGHPFKNVFSGWYWTSTSAALNPAYAWYVHTEGARMFYGSKAQYFLVWPVRGEGSRVLPRTGQQHCFDTAGARISCSGSGQDGELRLGAKWPLPRFEPGDDAVLDRLTGLRWQVHADLTGRPVTWTEALACAARLGQGWRLPNINELESLVDSSKYAPALPEGHPFENIQEGYWSSTTSMFEPDWAWALYLAKGAIGVGQKGGPHFFVWPVTG